MRRIIGRPATGMAGLARTSVSGRRRVPRPAVRTSACEGSCEGGTGSAKGARSILVEQHLGGRRAARFAVAEVQRPVRIDDVVAGPAPERLGGLGNAPVAALDLDEGANRRL